MGCASPVGAEQGEGGRDQTEKGWGVRRGCVQDASQHGLKEEQWLADGSGR